MICGDAASSVPAAAPATSSATTRNTATVRILICDAQVRHVAARRRRRARRRGTDQTRPAMPKQMPHARARRCERARLTVRPTVPAMRVHLASFGAAESTANPPFHPPWFAAEANFNPWDGPIPCSEAGAVVGLARTRYCRAVPRPHFRLERKNVVSLSNGMRPTRS